jgi:hypothetical protein
MKRKLQETCVIAEEPDWSTMRLLLGNIRFLLEKLFVDDVTEINFEN